MVLEQLEGANDGEKRLAGPGGMLNEMDHQGIGVYAGFDREYYQGLSKVALNHPRRSGASIPLKPSRPSPTHPKG
jgi:hypothetical protein